LVSWAWIPISLFIGVVMGMFIIAFAAVSREDENKKKWWEE
jgi:hypothetical protein